MVKDGGIGPGRGSGIHFREGVELSNWIVRRREKKGDIAETNGLIHNAQAELASGRGVAAVKKAISSLAQVTNATYSRKILTVVSKLKDAKTRKSLADEMETLARSLNFTASEIRKLP